jgi:o-succinylbenzoate synthase
VGRVAGAAIEMAVLDCELRVAGESLRSRLHLAPGGVRAGAMVDIPEDRQVPTLLDAVALCASAGYRRIRVKIEPGWDSLPLRAVREQFPELDLQADANGAYQWGATGEAGATALVELDPLGLLCIEQPLPPADLPSHASLAELLDTPVCLDESLTSPRRLREALRYGACEVACLKPARLGGIFATGQAHDLCAGEGVPAFVGGFFETGLARAANAALAGLPGFTLPGDLSNPAGYLAEDPCGYEGPFDGVVEPPAGPGVGRLPDPDVLRRRTVAVRWIPAPPRRAR